MDKRKLYQDAFRINHSRLVSKLAAQEVISESFSKGVISFSEKNEIDAEKTDAEKINKLLMILHRRYFANPDVFVQFFDILEEVNDSEAGVMDHVINALHETISNPPDIEEGFGILSEEDRARLIANEATISYSLDVKKLLPELISESVVSISDAEHIETIQDFSGRGKYLIEVIKGHGSGAFQQFVQVLREAEVYEQLVLKLSGFGEQPSPLNVDEVLRNGHVPPPPQHYIPRSDLIKTIRKELWKLEKEPDGWVLIYGLPGFGKTVLAAEAIRKQDLLQRVCPGGVYWLSVGRMADSSGEINNDALLEKLQNFISRLDVNKYHPSNLESANDYLQTVMTEQHPQSLLILDDVWEVETAKAFAVRCRTLVTSRNAQVASGITVAHVYKVSIMQGFTNDEGKELLAKWIKKSVSDLPQEANRIITSSYGSPIALDIIGAMLQRNASAVRWRAIQDKLAKEHTGSLVVNSPHIGRRGSEGRKGRTKETLNRSIALCEEGLDEDITEYFHRLVVFDHDTIIPAEALVTVWDTSDELEAEDIMMTIVGWSLAQQARSQAGHGFMSFTMHDMVLDYLKDTISSEQQIRYHKDVVERYIDKCDGEFADLPPDKYIHGRLLAHADKANMTHLLPQLLSNLGWLAACVNYWDPNSLMGAYKKYRQHLPESVNQFQLFLSAHLDVFATRPSLQDVVQLALNNPDSQVLYEQALAMARKDRDTLWLTWCNASSIFRPTDLIQLQPHKTGAYCCQYYDNGSKVASCSSMTVKLWESSTGTVLQTFSGHDDHITHCVISKDGEIIISSSDDATCNVWEVDSHKLLLQFREHSDGVQCCDLSPDTSLVVSADIGAEVIVWDTRSGDIQAKWHHGDVGITSCKFTPSGDAVVVANQDGVLKMWNLKGSVVASFSLDHAPSSPGASFDFSFSRGPSRSTSGMSSGSNGPAFSVKECVFSRDGTLMAAAVGNCTARVWSVETSECMHVYGHSSDVLSVDISSDGRLLVVGCLAGNVKVWSLSEGRPVLDIPLHYDWVQCVEFSPDNSRILSSSSGSIKMIKRDSSEQSGKIYRRRYSVHYSQCDRGYTPTIVCFDMRQKHLEVCQGLEAVPTHTLNTIPRKNPRSWNISPDALHVVVGYDTGHLQLLELSTGKEVWLTKNAHTSKIAHCYFSPDDNRIVSCGESDKHHQAWSRGDGKLLSSQTNCQNYLVRPCVWYNDSVRIASTVPGQVMVWDSTTGKELFRCKGISDNLDESILCVNISKDNSKLIASSSIGRVAVWDAGDGSLLFTGDNNSSARYCSLNDNGSIAAVGYDDCTLKIFNITRGSEIQTPQNASSAWMIYTGFSPDGKQILTLSNSIEWWSTEGKLIKRFLLKNTFGKYLMFSPDFKIFVTIDNTGLLYVLSVLEDH